MEQLLPLVMELFTQIFFLVATIAMAYIIGWVRKKTTAEQQDLIKVIAEQGVIFAQQVYWAANGDEKFQQALSFLEKELQDRNINLTKEQMTVLIESTLKRLKKEFAEEWDK